MKKIGIITICIMIVMVFSLGFTGHATYQPNVLHQGDLNSQVSPDQTEVNPFLRPIFVGVDVHDSSDVTTVRERSEEIGEGAIVVVNNNVNLTFTYAVALNNETVFTEDDVDYRFFADLPLVNEPNFNNTLNNIELGLSSTSPNIPLNYTGFNETKLEYTWPVNPDVIFDNATLYYFETTIEVNMTVSYLPFYVSDVLDPTLSEIRNDAPYNLVTTGTYFNTSTKDTFYIQDEEIVINGSLSNGDPSMEIGIVYQINGTENNFENFTLSTSNNINFTGSINLGDFNPGSEISWYSAFYANDTRLNLTRAITRIDTKGVTVGDGNPEMEVEVLTSDINARITDVSIVSGSFNVTYNITSTVAKGNITAIQVIADTGEAAQNVSPVNGTLQDTELSFTFDYSTVSTADTDGGNFNTTITSTTDKGLSINQTFSVIIDTVRPTGVVTVEGGSPITTSTGEVTFTFSFGDDRSGVRSAILDFGDDSSVEVTFLSEYTHTYEDFDGEQYFIQLIVIDNAGNQEIINSFVDLEAAEIDVDNSPGLEIALFFIFLVALLTSIWWAPVFYDRVGEPAMSWLKDKLNR